MKSQHTFTLSSHTLNMVRHLVEDERVAPSQDALVERALADFFMSVRHEREARQFLEASADPVVRAELSLLEAEFRSADAETWPK